VLVQWRNCRLNAAGLRAVFLVLAMGRPFVTKQGSQLVAGLRAAIGLLLNDPQKAPHHRIFVFLDSRRLIRKSANGKRCNVAKLLVYSVEPNEPLPARQLRGALLRLYVGFGATLCCSHGAVS
jgi:hypothetical protein